MILKWVIFVCAAIASATVGFMTADRAIPFVRYHGTITPENPMPGSAVTITWEGQRYRDCPGTVYRRIVDSHNVPHSYDPVVAVYAKTENPDPMARTFKLPAGIAPGPAVYIATTYFVCNPVHLLWPIVVSTPVIHFTIADPEYQKEP